MVKRIFSEMKGFIISDSDHESEPESDSEVFIPSISQIIHKKRQRTPPKRFIDEIYVVGCGCCPQKGKDGTDMSFDNRK